MTDVATTRPYGVLGRVLGHSYTPTIYKEERQTLRAF